METLQGLVCSEAFFLNYKLLMQWLLIGALSSATAAAITLALHQ